MGLLPEDELIDLSLLQQWVKRCDNQHSNTCHSFGNSWKRLDYAKSLILIDVEKRCLVQRSGRTSYLALSYVWGENHQEAFQTTVSNLANLCQAGAFEIPSNRDRLPETIQDSMILTHKMGLKYLWVDRFCIVQDTYIKHDQLKEMASIYANAYFTIAACEGHNDKFGLLGISKSRPRSRPFWHIDFGSGCRMISRQPIRCMEPAPFHTRGWTFQEIMLSPRVLSFHHNTVSWKCRVMCQDENGTTEPHYMNEILPTTDCRISETPNPVAYAELVSTYSTRDLTYQEDALDAFSAIIAVMGNSMRGGILFGLPESCFSAALLWKPKYYSIRRTDALNTTLKQFPSWSWLGWKGPVKTDLWRALIMSSSEFGLDQRISYFKIGSATRLATQINDTHFNKDQNPKSEGSATRLAARMNGVASYEDAISLPYPGPYHHQETWDTVIKFTTERCFVRERKSSDTKKKGLEDAYLVNENDQIVGVLEYREQDKAQPKGGKSPIKTRELICISRMEVKWTWDSYRLMKETKLLHEACPKHCFNRPDRCLLGAKWTYKCCNVLWIEWEDNIAYRKAVGRVSQEFWDASSAEIIYIRLG
jgi:hypothetical protein